MTDVSSAAAAPPTVDVQEASREQLDQRLGTEFYPKGELRARLLEQNQRSATPADLPSWRQDELVDASRYIADDGLADALNVALVLGQPLLLTGEPGTGKTQFAYSATYWLGFNKLIRFNVKSTTQERDFFYYIDEVRRFRDAQLLNLSGKQNDSQSSEAMRTSSSASGPQDGRQSDEPETDPLDIRNYMTLGPLGEAILRANESGAFPQLVPPDNHRAKERSIVLIDEIDKAPRDVPNDLLNEFENMEFEVQELATTIRADQAMRPVLIITSNSERNLPDAFLRRCIYYNIPFPGDEVDVAEGSKASAQEEALLRIVSARLPEISQDSTWLTEALQVLRRLRERGRGVQKRPGTAELLSWLLVLHARNDVQPKTSLKESPELFEATLPILMKNKADADIAWRIFNAYRAG